MEHVMYLGESARLDKHCCRDNRLFALGGLLAMAKAAAPELELMVFGGPLGRPVEDRRKDCACCCCMARPSMLMARLRAA